MQDDGGTANGGSRSRSGRQDDHDQRLADTTTAHRPPAAPTARSARSKTRPTRCRSPTSASATPTIPPDTLPWRSASPRCPTSGTLRDNGGCGRGRPARPGQRHHQRQAHLHAAGQRQRARRSPASPSRCRTTAARSSAASTSTGGRTRVTFNVTAVNDAPSGPDKAVATNEDAAYTFSRSRLRLQRPERLARQHLAGGQDHHAAGSRHADLTAAWPSRSASRSRRPTWPRATSVPPGRQRQRHAAMPASPSRCRTTAARPMAASIPTPRPRRSSSTSQREQRPGGAGRTIGMANSTATTARSTRSHGRFRLQRSERQPGQQPPGGQDHALPSGTLKLERHGRGGGRRSISGRAASAA